MSRAIADELGRHIIPVRLTDTPLSGTLGYTLANSQWIDFFSNPDEAIQRIVGDLPIQRQMRVRSRTWDIPEDQKRTLARNFLRGALALSVLGAVAFLGYKFFDARSSLRQCDAAALSEFELEDGPNGLGLPDGLIDPPRSLETCRRAVANNADVPRAHFQLARAQGLNGLDAGAELRAAASLGHAEAILSVNLTEPSEASDASPPRLTPQGRAVLARLLDRANSGDGKATALIARFLPPTFPLRSEPELNAAYLRLRERHGLAWRKLAAFAPKSLQEAGCCAEAGVV